MPELEYRLFNKGEGVPIISEHNIGQIRKAYGRGLSNGDFLPAIYVVEPTSNCNVNCIMCPQSSLSTTNIGEMDLSTADLIATAISPYAELIMLYFMGEPLLHSNFNRLLSLFRSHNRGKIVISTNALLLDEDRLLAIFENDVDVVICCIDRWEQEAYEGIRRGSDFWTVVSNTEQLLALRGSRNLPLVIVKALDLQMPLNEQTDFKAYWNQRGGIPIVGWVDTWAGQFPNLVKLSNTAAPYVYVKRVPCADLWFKMVINWRGEAVMCCHNYDYSYPLGRITSQDSLKEIWQGENITALRSAHINKHFSCTTLCAGCREWGDIKELEAYVGLKEEDLALVF